MSRPELSETGAFKRHGWRGKAIYRSRRQHVMAQAKETGHRRKALMGVGALHSLKHQITAPSIQLVHLSRRERFRVVGSE
jgi:hypothetical protein